jgi:hypothetical protein
MTNNLGIAMQTTDFIILNPVDVYNFHFSMLIVYFSMSIEFNVYMVFFRIQIISD